MRKLVDVFIADKLRATYPVVLEEPEEPSDGNFIDHVRERIPRAYTAEEITAARFVVRDS